MTTSEHVKLLLRLDQAVRSAPVTPETIPLLTAISAAVKDLKDRK